MAKRIGRLLNDLKMQGKELQHIRKAYPELFQEILRSHQSMSESLIRAGKILNLDPADPPRRPICCGYLRSWSLMQSGPRGESGSGTIKVFLSLAPALAS